MNQYCRIIPAALAIAAACSSVKAAPLDALLSAAHDEAAGKGEVEAGYDMMNSSLDFLNLRTKSSTTTSSVGDYKGAHLHAGIALTPRLWIDGTYWKRRIDYRSFDAALNSWQVAGQYKLTDAAGAMPAIALRAGAWGDYAGSLTKYSNSTVAGTKYTSATVTKPKDRQFQLDLIGTWLLSPQSSLSVFGGANHGRVTFDTVSATARVNGCEYNIAFSNAGIEGTLAQPCNAKVVITRFTQPASSSIDVYKEAQYGSTTLQAGAMAEWHNTDWRLRAGYQYQTMKRDHVDDIITSRGSVAYKHNHVLVTDVSYNVTPSVALFVRGQLMSNQFNGEIPLAYNSLTAEKYHQKYGFVSTGLTVAF